MKTQILNWNSMLLIATALLGSCSHDSFENSAMDNSNKPTSGSSQTAQSIMIKMDPVENYILGGNSVFKFDELKAAKELYNYDACSLLIKQNEQSHCRNSALDKARENKCSIFESEWDSQNFVYWTKLKGPTSDSSTDIEVSIGGEIAAESFVLNSKKGVDFGKKWSYTLFDSNGLLRISKLRYVINGVDVNDGSQNLIAENISLDPLDTTCWNNYFYKPSTQFFGNSAVFSYLTGNQGNTMGDVVSNNDYGSKSTCLNAQVAKIVPKKIILPAVPGTYDIEIRGTIKGNDGSSVNSEFSVKSKKVHITAEGCK